MSQTDPVLTAAKEFLNVLQTNQGSSDWEERLRLFAGNDRRILDRIPLLRRKYGAINSEITKVREFIFNYQTTLDELN